MTSFRSDIVEKTIASTYPKYSELSERRAGSSIGGKSCYICVLKSKDANLGVGRRLIEGFGLLLLTLGTAGFALLCKRVRDRWDETRDGKGVKYIKLAFTDIDRRLSSSGLTSLGIEIALSADKQKLLNNIIERASLLLGLDKDSILEILQKGENQTKINEAFTTPIPGSPPIAEDAVDNLPPILVGMTMREILILGAIATILGKNKILEEACVISKQKDWQMSGELLEIEPGRKLQIQKFGAYNPEHRCIIMESGSGGNGWAWQGVKELLNGTPVYGLSYDRAGLGFSDPSPDPGSIKQIIKDFDNMLTLLEKKGEISRPYILVGHSFGGICMQVYAKMFPEKVAGLILVDSSSDAVVSDPRMKSLLNAPLHQDFPLKLIPLTTAQLLFPRACDGLTGYAEAARIRENIAILGDYAKGHSREDPLFGNLPLRVLTKPKTLINSGSDSNEIEEEAWQEHQRELVERSLNSKQIICADGVGHHIHNDAPQVVADAIQNIIKK